MSITVLLALSCGDLMVLSIWDVCRLTEIPKSCKSFNPGNTVEDLAPRKQAVLGILEFVMGRHESDLKLSTSIRDLGPV
jgi:hypothetical protein